MNCFKYVAWLGLFCTSLTYANFTNDGFEDTYTPSLSSPNATITGWTSAGYLFTGYAPGLILPPKSLADITLNSAPSAPNGISDIVFSNTPQSIFDWFLNNATPTTTIKLPVTGTQTAMINLRSVNSQQSVSGTSVKPQGWRTYGQQATALSQTITITNADLSSGLAHIRFKIAPVLENPAHAAKQQPFYAIQINNLTTGRAGLNPLFFQWSYAGQAGVPWQTLSKKGSNSGSNATYNYTDWQNFDFAPGPGLNGINVGDQIQLIVLAAGCSPGGHDGHIYLDDVSTVPLTPTTPSLLINVSTTSTTVAAGQSITYTYTYTNNGSTDVQNVTVQAHMPQTQGTATPFDTIFSSTTCPIPNFDATTNLLNCSVKLAGTALVAGETGTFTMTILVPSNWQPSYGPINNGNYPIQGAGVSPVLGNLVQTNIMAGTPPPNVSNLVVNVSGMNNNNLTANTAYAGSYSCNNQGPADATNATCNISNLPDGLTVTGCTITGGPNPFVEPSTIPAGDTVSCQVAGVPTSDISRQIDAVVQSIAANNQNSISNYAVVPFNIYNNPVSVPATLNGSPVLSPARVCCGRPVLMLDLSIPSDLAATYRVVSTTGNISCSIGSTGPNFYVKVLGRPGTCTLQGTKNAQISAPLAAVPANYWMFSKLTGKRFVVEV